MERLNINQTAILLDWPKDRCRYHFGKIEDLPAFLYEENKKTGKQEPVSESRINREWLIEIGRIESQIGISINPLIVDVQANFTRNKACMDYVMKAIQSKIKPAKKNGFYPLKISIPNEVNFLITPEQRQEIIGKIPQYLTPDQNKTIEKHKIKII